MDTNRMPLSVGLLLQRLAMGLFLLLAGVGKFVMGLENFYNYFLKLKPDWLPEVVAMPYGYAIPFLEVIVGAMLILGLFTRVSAWVGFAMVTSFTLAMVLAKQTLRFPEGTPFTPNLIMLTVLFMIGIAGAGWISLDGLWRKKKG